MFTFKITYYKTKNHLVTTEWFVNCTLDFFLQQCEEAAKKGTDFKVHFKGN